MAARSFRLSGMIKAAFLLAITAAIAPTAASGTDNVEISLTRSACFGACPAYKLTIDGHGLVHFTTGTDPVDEADKLHRRYARARGVLLPGTHEDRISPEAVQALLKQFEAANFWRLKNEYRALATDSPTQVVSLTVGDRHKRVVDYMGTEAGMPDAVRNLEEAIDRVAGSDRWVKGTAGLIPWLEQAHFDFHSNQATVLALDGEADQADEATVLALIERGAPLEERERSYNATPAGWLHHGAGAASSGGDYARGARLLIHAGASMDGCRGKSGNAGLDAVLEKNGLV